MSLNIRIMTCMHPLLLSYRKRGKQFTLFGRLELEWGERKILLGWLELELVAGVV